MLLTKSVARFLLFLWVLLSLVAVVVQPVYAHERVELGPYSVVVGWREEPAIVGERNALLLIIAEGEVPVEGAEATLDVELLYGGRSFRANLTPSLTPGEYTAELFPTVRGQYEVRLFGTIGTVPVDTTVLPEEIFAASRIQFPEALPDILDLQESIEVDIVTLQAQLQTLRWLAVSGIGVGILGLCVAIFALIRRR